MIRASQITADDNVATMIDPIAAGKPVSVGGNESLVACEAIDSGHKIALVAIAAGAEVIKYGVRIGQATAPIAAETNGECGVTL